MKGVKLADRISTMTTSIFATMSKMAFDFKAINLGQGFPDFDGPSWLMGEAYIAMKTGKNQYAPSMGIHSLRKNISEIQKEFYGMDYDFENEIIITAGATEGLFSSIHAFIEQGDEVILFEPYYDAYIADVVLAGGTPRFVTLHKPDFIFILSELEEAINEKTKMIIINSPHNPTGKVFTLTELEEISRLAIKHNLIVLSDEVYEFLTYDNAKHIPIATLPGMRERTITISSTGKTFGMTGWKIGYVTAPNYLATAIQKVHQWATFAVNTPGQNAMAFGFTQMPTYLDDFKNLYQSRRDLMLQELSKTKFTAHKPLGSYFIMVDIPNHIFRDDIDAATKLVQEFGVATIPPSVFYSRSDEGKTMLRLCFAKSEETIISGIACLGKL